MVLQDSALMQYMDAPTPLMENFDPNQLTGIGYDLRTEFFAVSERNSRMDSYTLRPQGSVFVGTVENIRLPSNLMARVVLRNSCIRQGLSLEAPVYQPGHETKVFFRITNVSAAPIVLKAGESLATIVFEELAGEAEHPYQGMYSKEMECSGLGKYGSVRTSYYPKLNFGENNGGGAKPSAAADVGAFARLLADLVTISTAAFTICIAMGGFLEERRNRKAASSKRTSR